MSPSTAEGHHDSPGYLSFPLLGRRDILAPEVCDILEPIQWQTRPHTWKQTVGALHTLREDWGKVLTIADKKCMLGSGSVAQVKISNESFHDDEESVPCVATMCVLSSRLYLQVYKGEAFLPNPNDPSDPPLPKPVAIKVIHPDVKKQIELDLELMRFGGK